jgi:hypothetical protein
MNRISSSWTYFWKRVFPAIWFVMLLLMAIAVIASAPSAPALLFPLFVISALSLFAYFLLEHLVFDLVDEVFDNGETLLVKNNGQEESIRLADISNVSYTVIVNPPRVTLSLRTQSKFGKEVRQGQGGD